ncbi:hypothetical protein M3Y98_00008300 [Aphelenchoides besseyi]|nr:hypothetical protein M3Y98_00008300 [Aphelenchoides besseyi]KAI6199131.1 hypothetical protein M3Y96_00593800 [Aphelenchoides besseyi]
MKTVVFLALVFLGAQACTHEGRQYKNGDEWVVRNSFVMRCTTEGSGSWRTQVVACLSPNGQKIPLNQTRDEPNSNFQWNCQMNPNGHVALSQEVSPNAKCDGHSVGSRWQEKSFELECRSGGIKELKACITEDGQRIPVNRSLNINGFTLQCQQFANGTVIFHGAKSVNAPRQFSSQSPHRCLDEQSIEREIGDHWVENHRFNKTCKPSGVVEVVNCISKEGYKIPLNSQVIRGSTKYTCDMTDGGTIRFAAGPVA